LATHKDARKRIKQAEARRLRNKAVRTRYRLEVRKVRSAIKAGDVRAAESALKTAVSALDRAASKGVIHQKTADRNKTRLSKALRDMKSGGEAAKA